MTPEELSKALEDIGIPVYGQTATILMGAKQLINLGHRGSESYLRTARRMFPDDIDMWLVAVQMDIEADQEEADLLRDCMRASASIFRKEWDTPEEDEAWAHLQDVDSGVKN